jgi:hypothetical protein
VRRQLRRYCVDLKTHDCLASHLSRDAARHSSPLITASTTIYRAMPV